MELIDFALAKCESDSPGLLRWRERTLQLLTAQTMTFALHQTHLQDNDKKEYLHLVGRLLEGLDRDAPVFVSHSCRAALLELADNGIRELVLSKTAAGDQG